MVLMMADFERKSANDVDAGSHSCRLQSRFREPLCRPPGRSPSGQSLAAAPRENVVAWATVWH